MILGTAGHIDHGKTALVKALTGVDTDRLPEEKRRGITIDLGFAPLRLDGVGTIGIVDVPGHEAFVRTMLAGASGIDIALLVVAADEGVMPQTREHLEILSLLGIPKLIVALTKSDLVTDEWLALAVDDVRSLLRETPFAVSEIIGVSAIRGGGLDSLRQAIKSAAGAPEGTRQDDDLFRMPVDRAFTMKGTGTVVTGTVWSGSIDRETTVTVFPPGRESRVRGIQRHGAAVKRAEPGERIALALPDVDVQEVDRGSVVVAGGEWTATSRVEAELRMSSDEVHIGPRTRLRFHLGTAEVGARISRRSMQERDGRGFIGVVALDEPLLIRGGDRFVLRLPSPPSTIGGGIVRDPFVPLRRRRAPRTPKSVASAEAELPRPRIGESAEELLARMAASAGIDGLPPESLPVRLGVAFATVSRLVQRAGLVQIQSRLYDPRALEALEDEVESFVRDHVENFPLEPGVQLHGVRSALRAQDGVIDVAVNRLVETSRIEVDRSVAKPAGWSPKLSKQERALADAILHEICVQPEAPPSVSELVASFGEKASGLLRYLERSAEIIRVSDDRYYAPRAVAAMVGKLRARLEPSRVYSPAELREVLGVSRKYLIPFLEFCDVTGVTDRKAEGRVIAADRP